MKKQIVYLKSTFPKNHSRRLAALLLVTAVGITSLQPVFASRKSQAQDAKQAAESNLNSVNNSINNITGKQQELQKEINALDAELVELLINMDILSDELTDKEAEIKQANIDLKAAEKEEKEQYERMKMRVRSVYERGNNSLLEALLGATSMSDFLNRVNYYNAVYDYDREQLEVYKDTKQQVADLKAQLLTEQSEMEEMQDNYKLQETDLKSMVSRKEATMDDFDSQLSQAKVLAAAYKETIQEQNQIIRDEEEKERIAAEAAERAAREAAEAAERAAREAAERGEVSPEKKRLVDVAKECVSRGLEAVKPWGFLGDMGQAVHDHAFANGYTIVREIGGHGVGLEFHEDPWVSYNSRRGEEMLMVPGMIFTIEPMVNMGAPDIYVDEGNDWTVYTEDGKPSAQWEIMVLVTEDGAEVLSY